MSCLILDTQVFGPLLHLLCHCTSPVVGLLSWRNNFDSGWHVNCNAILPCVTDPTHELFDP